MPIQINGDLTGPEADQLRAVLAGQADYFSARVFVDGRFLTLLVALPGAAPPAPEPEAPAFVSAVQKRKVGWPGGTVARPVPVSTGVQSAEATTPGNETWERVFDPNAVEPKPKFGGDEIIVGDPDVPAPVEEP